MRCCSVCCHVSIYSASLKSYKPVAYLTYRQVHNFTLGPDNFHSIHLQMPQGYYSSSCGSIQLLVHSDHVSKPLIVSIDPFIFRWHGLNLGSHVSNGWQTDFAGRRLCNTLLARLQISRSVPEKFANRDEFDPCFDDDPWNFIIWSIISLYPCLTWCGRFKDSRFSRQLDKCALPLSNLLWITFFIWTFFIWTGTLMRWCYKKTHVSRRIRRWSRAPV